MSPVLWMLLLNCHPEGKEVQERVAAEPGSMTYGWEMLVTEPLDALSFSRTSTTSIVPVPWPPKAEGVLAFITTEALRRLFKTVPTLDWEHLNANSSGHL